MQKKYAHWTYYKSPVGWLSVSGNGGSIAEIAFMHEEPQYFYSPVPDYLLDCVRQLEEYFAHERQVFDFQLDFRTATDFQRRVWELLLAIPFGQTSTYMKIAHQLGDTNAMRAVGGAAGQNPLIIVVPCHRIIGTDGSLTGFAGGLDRKEFLLNLERPDVFAKQSILF
jgi:methylated-DNA-[protein]-cysteine S-methyltransferase